MPVTTVLLGRFPSSWLGFGEDLPAGVARDWSAWCRAPEYFGTWTGHAALQIPLLAYSFSDDWIAPRRAANALLARYEGAQRVHHHLAPADIGRTAVGHFGFFRSGFVPELWDDVGTFFDTNDDGHRT